MGCIAAVPRKPWSLPFTAEPEEVAALRRIMRLHLGLWGLHDVIDAAQLCVSELVSNVIAHVGVGTPTTLAVSMNGIRLRIEVHDPDTRALPTLLDSVPEAESGRGMALVSAVTSRWGVRLEADHKVTWCELATGLSSEDGHSGGLHVSRVETLMGAYARGRKQRSLGRSSVLSVMVAEEKAIDIIADVLHWLRAHGCDVEAAIDRAQTHFEAEIGT